MLALGAGLVPMLRSVRSRRELLVRLPLAYPVGIAATGIVSAHLALVHVPTRPTRRSSIPCSSRRWRPWIPASWGTSTGRSSIYSSQDWRSPSSGARGRCSATACSRCSSVLLAIVAAPTFFNQLQTNYADLPLAIFVALGVAARATRQFALAALSEPQRLRRTRGSCSRLRRSSPRRP
jgi:hypothetical protein